MLPPLGEPAGPEYDDEELLRAFARKASTGHSANYHIEGASLMTGGDAAAALWIGPDTVLVRADLPSRLEDRRPPIDNALRSEGYDLLDANTLFAAPIAIQVLGLRISSWDLWGRDLDQSFAELRDAAAGIEESSLFSQDPFGQDVPGADPFGPATTPL